MVEKIISGWNFCCPNKSFNHLQVTEPLFFFLPPSSSSIATIQFRSVSILSLAAGEAIREGGFVRWGREVGQSDIV